MSARDMNIMKERPAPYAAFGLALSALLALATLPQWAGNSYYIDIASQVLLFAVFALALNVLVGYGGLVSLGHAGLFAVSAYTAALMLQAGFGHAAAIGAAVLTTLLASAVFAVLALRATGIGFLMISLALGQILWGIAYRWADLTNGDNGVSITSRPAPFGISLADAPSFYYATLVVFLIALAAMAAFERSPFGASLRGTRDQARRMTALGYHDGARLQCLADPLPGVPILRLLVQRRRAALSLQQAVRRPAGRGAAGVGRGAADGDLRRHGDAARAGRGRSARRHREIRGERLRDALEPRARRHLRRDHQLHAGGPGARLDPPVGFRKAAFLQGS
jgi:hypothetical protein